jgi:anaerobic magnesium-protoporphyrin IX monomethyl ester cyclase
VITVVGGSHPTAIPEETLQEFSSIDIIVIGEGEKTVSELVECLSKKKKIEKVDGICIRKGKKIVRTNPRPFINNLDEISFPAHDLLPLNSYSYWIQHGGKFAPLLTSRGCPYKCTFCCRGCFGNYYRKRSIENVIGEIKWLTELGVDEIHIIDDNFTLIKKYAVSILDEIIKNFPELHLALINGVRADKINKEILIKMKKANIYYIGFGVESGDQNILDSVKKRISLSQAEKAVQLSKNVGIEIIACFFILGLPSENRKSILKTMEFAKKLNPDFVKFSTFVPYPGTEIYDKLKNDGRILTGNWDKYSTYGSLVFKHPNLSMSEFVYLQKKAYTSFFLSNMNLIFKHFIRGMINPKFYKNIFKVLPDFLSFVL